MEEKKIINQQMGEEEEGKEENQKKMTNKENIGPNAGGKRWPKGR